MNWWKRPGLAFISAIFAEALVIAVVAAFNPPGARLDGFVLMGSFALYLVVPGWILSLPAVLSVRTANRRDLIVLAVIGMLIGPLMVAALDLWTSWKNPTFIPRGPGPFEYLATAISILATMIYLASFKGLSRVSIQLTTHDR